MKKLVLILGNGLTMDLLSNLDEKKDNIDLSNLFSKGDTVTWPDGRHERGFLSYKYCPSLWNLGARPNMDQVTASDLIENIIRACFVTSNRLKDKQYGLKYGRIGARELGKGKEKACSYGGGADV